MKLTQGWKGVVVAVLVGIMGLSTVAGCRGKCCGTCKDSASASKCPAGCAKPCCKKDGAAK